VSDAPQSGAAPPVPAPKPLVVGPKPSAKLTTDPGDASPHGHTAEAFELMQQVIFAPTVLLP